MSTDQQMILMIMSYNGILEKYLNTHDKIELCNDLKTLIEISVSSDLIDREYNGFTLRNAFIGIIESEDLLSWLKRKPINE